MLPNGYSIQQCPDGVVLSLFKDGEPVNALTLSHPEAVQLADLLVNLSKPVVTRRNA